MKQKPYSLVLTILLLLTTIAHAGPVTFRFEGTVTSIRDPNEVIGTGVAIGSLLSGTYTFESTAPDSRSSDPSVGIFSVVTEISGDLGSIPFSGPRDGGPTTIGVILNDPDRFAEGYFLNVGVGVDGWAAGFRLDILSEIGNILQNDSLPLTPPNLALFDSATFRFSLGEVEHVGGVVTRLVPEPATLVLLTVGAATLGRRHKAHRLKPTNGENQ